MENQTVGALLQGALVQAMDVCRVACGGWCSSE